MKYFLVALWLYLKSLAWESWVAVWWRCHPSSFDRWFYGTFMVEYRKELEAKHNVRLSRAP